MGGERGGGVWKRNNGTFMYWSDERYHSAMGSTFTLLYFIKYQFIDSKELHLESSEGT